MTYSIFFTIGFVTWPHTVWLQISVRQYFHEFRYWITCHENIWLENLFMMTGLYKYFKPTKPSSGSQLPEPDGHLSITVPSTSIVAANQEVSKVLATEKSASGSSGSKQCGTYAKYTPKQKATIGNYSISHGTSAALRYFKAEFPDLKWSTVNDWKVAIMHLSKFCPTYAPSGNVGEYEGIWPVWKLISPTVGQNFWSNPLLSLPYPLLRKWGLHARTNILEYTRWNVIIQCGSFPLS